jgi:4-hydroxy-tetrahydrodipicolinate synthase
MRFRGDPAGIRGSIAPVVSPFTADGLFYLESLRGLVRRQLESGSCSRAPLPRSRGNNAA